jgi:DNA-binding NtrC family response regulator
MSKRIALVGHCGPDSYMLRSAVKYAVPGSDVAMITDQDALADLLAKGVDLLLVNRVLDGLFDAGAGIELIGSLAKSHPGVPTILISNYADSQRDAEAAGAKPGFGKAEIGTPKMKQSLAGALGE